MKLALPDVDATQALGRDLAAALVSITDGALITLTGELGAGKTALARAVIGALGYDGPVVSPTYTLMEPYTVAGRQICHLDLYRLAVPEELEYLGIRDLAGAHDWLLVEWPERGAGYLPEADLDVALAYADPGRVATITAATGSGRTLRNVLRPASKKYGDSEDI